MYRDTWHQHFLYGVPDYAFRHYSFFLHSWSRSLIVAHGPKSMFFALFGHIDDQHAAEDNYESDNL